MKSSAFLLALSLALSAIGAEEEGEKMIKAKMKFETVKDLSINNAFICLPARHSQKGVGPLLIEGESFTGIEFQEASKRVTPLQEASNGMLISFVKMLNYRFEIKAAGKYTVYTYARFPLVAGYNHSEQMDEGPNNRVNDSEALPANIWHWCKGHTYELTAGEHSYLFPSPHAWCGGAQMDKIVLIPEGDKTQPGAVTDANTVLAFPPSGSATTRRIKTARIQDWRMEFEAVPNGGQITVEHSYDNKNFTALEAGKSYQVPEKTSGYAYFRVNMKAAPGGKVSPWLYDLKLMVTKKALPAN